MIKEVPINDNWLFCNGFDKECLDRGFSFANSFITSLPHNPVDCAEDYFDERRMRRLTTYARILTVPENYIGKRLMLRFEGVLSYVELYVNGTFVTSHKGETPFTADVTAPLRYNYENVIVLKVDSDLRKDVPCSGVRGPLIGYGGIFRDVVFMICDGRDIRDVCMRYNAADQTVTADVELYDWYPETELDGEIVGPGGKTLCTLSLRTVQGAHVRLKGDASGATLWSLSQPQMYTALIRLRQGDKVLDCKYVPFGFRTAQFTRDGFFLNGAPVKLVGVLRADCYPGIGRAATEQTERRDARLIKAAGLNAVRTMGPASRDFIDECNKIGLLVIEDVYGDGYIGEAEWREAFIAGVTDMVVRDRNAPSVIGWGVRVNNSRDCDELYFKAHKAAKEADPTRCTVGARSFADSHLYEDVFALCRRKGPYRAKHRQTPHLIGEHSGGAIAKPFDSERVRCAQALEHLRVLDTVLGTADAGAFGMSFCDFAAGRGHGSGNGLNHCGIFDAYRNPKLAAYAYKSQQDEQPVLVLSGNLATDEFTGRLAVFTNADSVVLYRDDQKAGEFFPDRKHYPHLKHPPIFISDFCGDLPAAAVGKGRLRLFKSILREAEKNGVWNMGFMARQKLKWLCTLAKLPLRDAVDLLEDFSRVPPKGVTYRFEGVYGGEVKSVRILSSDFTKTLCVSCDSPENLLCTRSYGRIAFSLVVEDGHGNPLPYEFMPVSVHTAGALQLEGDGNVSLKGGSGGFFVRNVGVGPGRVTVSSALGAQTFNFNCTATEWEKF